MRFRSNAAHRFDTHSPVDGPVDRLCDMTAEYPQAIHMPAGEDLFWPNGSDGPVDRAAFLAELNLERFGLKPKTSRRQVGDPKGEIK